MSVASLRIAAREACLRCRELTNLRTPAGRACCAGCWPELKAELEAMKREPVVLFPSGDPFSDIHTIQERTKANVDRWPVGRAPQVTFWNGRDRDGRRYSGYDRDWSTLPLDRREK